MDSGKLPSSPSSLLIIKLSALVDIVQALPVLNAIKATWPGCQVDWITGEVGADLLADHPLLRRVLVYPRRRLGRLSRSPFSWPKVLRELSGLKSRLHEGNYDIAMDLQGLFKSGLICKLSGARIRAGFDKGREMSHLFLNYRLPPYDPDRHAVLRYLDMAKALGATCKEIDFSIPITKDHVAEAKKLVQKIGAEERRFVILIPGTVWSTKKWISSYFAELSNMIYSGLGLKSVVVGGPMDKGLGRKIRQLSGSHTEDLTGKTDLKTLAALFPLAACAVSTDTGPMHLAAASGLRVVALFGPTAPWRTGPFGTGHVVIRKEMDCSPCFKRSCTHNSCMWTIKPMEVFKSVRELCKHSKLK